ncbi:MAG: LysM peptidoglycan-binding domain-containing protein [Anaerolineae bacterium]|nr:LysM peptidoglycan-binding domain-containing protein [Anaerolineae bacterium]
MQRRAIIGVLFVIFALAPPLSVQAQGGTTIHVVQRGENLFRIAMNYGTSVEAIAQTNSLADTTSIQVGQRLVIPSGLVNATVPTSERHITQPGETLAHIALRYGSTEQIVAALNNIVNPAQLYVGQVLDVSEAAPGHPALARGYTHTVQPGETLYRIALQYKAGLAEIERANNLTLPSVIYPGQQLLIPGPEDSPALRVLPAPLTEVNISPLPVEVGRTVGITITTSQPATLSGMFLDRPVYFVTTDGLTHEAVFGTHAFSEPGQYALSITAQDSGGASMTFTTALRVKDGGYGREQITVDPALMDEALNIAEHQVLAGMMSGFTLEKYYDGPLGLPAAAPVTSRFGTRRSYNGGAYDRFHTGTDFAGPPGAPIYAPANGQVVMVDTLNIYGLCTIIDHGWGVYTMYAHQTDSMVQAGQSVTSGETIGTIGNSGRSSGPHLHWEVWVSGVEVDGLQWTRMSLP